MTSRNVAWAQTPKDVVFPSEQTAPERTVELVMPTEMEADAYNYALSLHQRDVVRAGPGKTRPAEWGEAQGGKGASRKGKTDCFNQRVASQASVDWARVHNTSSTWMQPSAEK